MTEQSKIPLPGDDGTSLIERAAAAFDLASFSPPPVPHSLAPLRRRAPSAPAPAVVEPTPRQVELEPRSDPAEPAPAVAEAPVVEAPVLEAPSFEAPAAIVPAEAARFAGEPHPVDRERLREQGMIVPEGAVTALIEEFRIVKRQVLLHSAELSRAGAGASGQRVLICSPHPGEGKTYCAVNLALALAAEKEREVLLVDADFAKPSVLSVLGLPGGPGLMDALTDPEVDVAECVIGTDVPGLWVLPAGSSTTSDSEYLSSSRTAAVLDRLTQGAPQRIVIFDSPPALAASPAAELAKYVGQALVVVRADRTGQGSLEDAVSLLSGCPNIELLLNAVQFSPSGRRFGSYYGYGER